MALYPFVHVSALELHTLSRYPGNRQTDRNTNRLPYAFAAHAHRGITNNTAVLAYWKWSVTGGGNSLSTRVKPYKRLTTIQPLKRALVRLLLLRGSAEPLQHCIRPQNSVTSLYGRYGALNFPYMKVTELWGLRQCCKDTAKPCIPNWFTTPKHSIKFKQPVRSYNVQEQCYHMAGFFYGWKPFANCLKIDFRRETFADLRQPSSPNPLTWHWKASVGFFPSVGLPCRIDLLLVSLQPWLSKQVQPSIVDHSDLGLAPWKKANKSIFSSKTIYM